MANQTWQVLYNAYQVSGATSGAKAESFTEEAISPGKAVAGQACTFPAGYLLKGNLIRVTAKGIYNFAASKKLALILKLGGVELAKTLEVTTISSTNLPFIWETTSRVSEAGEKGRLLTQGVAQGLFAESTASASTSITMIPATSSTGGESAEVNLASQAVLALYAKSSESAAGNNVQVFQFLVEVLN